MADPLSITASVLALIKVSIQVSVLLTQFRDEVKVVDATLNSLISDVKGFQQVLESMEETFQQDDIKANLQVTGHVGNHWKNLARSLNDGAATLQQLHQLLLSVNKTTSFLSGPRKQLRLKSAVDQIAAFREQIKSYRSALQLSLSTVMLWNQVTFQKSTENIPDRILPNLDSLHAEFRSFGLILNSKIESLQGMVLDQRDRNELITMRNLKETMKAAVDVVSTASTTMTAGTTDVIQSSASDFGDLFQDGPNETMMRWMDSHTVYEYEDDENSATLTANQNAGDRPTDYHSDSDSDIEAEMVKALFQSATKRKAAGDLEAAKRLSLNCLTRISPLSHSGGGASTVSKTDILELLTTIYVDEGHYKEATSTISEKLTILGRGGGWTDEVYLQDTLRLVQILIWDNKFDDARLQARRSLRGFKKLGESGYEGYRTCLVTLIGISTYDKKVDEEDAYSALLASHEAKMQKHISENDTKSLEPHPPPDSTKAITTGVSKMFLRKPLSEASDTKPLQLSSSTTSGHSERSLSVGDAQKLQISKIAEAPVSSSLNQPFLTSFEPLPADRQTGDLDNKLQTSLVDREKLRAIKFFKDYFADIKLAEERAPAWSRFTYYLMDDDSVWPKRIVDLVEAYTTWTYLHQKREIYKKNPRFNSAVADSANYELDNYNLEPREDSPRYELDTSKEVVVYVPPTNNWTPPYGYGNEGMFYTQMLNNGIESHQCPICSMSLMGLSADAASLHVNGCLDFPHRYRQSPAAPYVYTSFGSQYAPTHAQGQYGAAPSYQDPPFQWGGH